MERVRAVELLRRAPFVHLATTSSTGTPILRTLHGAIVDDWICFHGAPAGEKLEAIGREAVVSAEEMVAEIPSYFSDPERACPATTFYEAVQAHGVLEPVGDAVYKARALQALMERYQPEGGHVPITADHPLYKKAVEGILILRVSLERLDGKSKMGQNRKPEELAQLLERLWRRGRPGDVQAIERIRAAIPVTPPFLTGPGGTTLSVAPGPRDAAQVAALLDGTYWSIGVDKERIARAQLGPCAWIVARDGAGDVVSSARALADGAKHAWIFDVITRPDRRGQGLAKRVMGLLLDHPLTRDCIVLRLNTRDAQQLYEGFGFSTTHVDATGRVTMTLSRT
jgi:nitroimidazol reductase NimA-like FMN-containing flavoprotein (pyridoxamine 5'-phosphate oxidase superfamily)/GNAT superfamily N-acetyltransferase